MSSRASLNHIFRTVWNQALGAMVAVAETDSSSSGTSGRRVRAAALQRPPEVGIGLLALSIAIAWSALPSVAIANPTGGVAVVGQATFVNNGNKLQVTTQNGANGNYSAINWQSFSIPTGSSTYFQQPTATSTSINRVVTNTPTQIFGTLSSNGNLVLVNQAGIAVGAGAVVDTNGFTASSLAMSDADAMAGRLRFGDGVINTAGVSVNGSILARSGDVVLLGANVNTGVDALVQAPNGSAILAAGQQIDITGRGLEGIRLQVQAPSDSAINLGILKGDAVGMFAGTLKHSGLIQATAATLEGGRVVLKASGDAIVEGNGSIVATGATGGSVDVLGQRVALTDQANIDVSGQHGGGSIRVGGDYQGGNAAIGNAAMTYFGQGANLRADALEQGNGGRVIVWADDVTRAYGAISARGGDSGGNGGFVETSGKGYLDFQGKVDTRAPNGAVGTLLLDPADITISSGADAAISGAAPFVGTNSMAPSVLSVATLIGALNSGNVVVDASGGVGMGIGSVTVANAVSWANSNQLTLQASASGGIAINAGISAPSGSLKLVAGNGGVAQSAAIAASSLEVTSTGAVTLANAGNAVNAFRATVTVNTNTVTYWNSGSLSLGPISVAGGLDINSGGGNITQSGPISTGGSVAFIDAGAGNITLTNASNNVSSAAVHLTGSGISFYSTGALNVTNLVRTGNHVLDLQSTGGGLVIPTVNIDTGTENLTLAGASSFSTQGNLSGANITLTGNGLNLNHVLSASGALKLDGGTVGISQGLGNSSQPSYLQAASLEAMAAGAGGISINSTSNLVSTLKITSGSGYASYFNNGALSLGPIATTGNIGISTAAGKNISQSGAITVGSYAMINAGNSGSGYGTLVLMNPGNDFANVYLGGSQVSVYDQNNLTVSGLTATTGATLVQAANNLTLSGTLNSDAPGDAIKFVSGGTFNGSSGYLNLSSGRWLAYLTTQTGHTFPSNSPAAFKQYNAVNGSAVLGAGNGVLFSDAPSLSGTLTGTAAKVYDGGVDIDVSGASVSGLTGAVGSDSLTSATASLATGSLSDPNAGTGKTVFATGTVSGVLTGYGDPVGLGLPVYGYQFNASGDIGTVAQALATINLTGTRVYDGTNIVNANIFSLSGLANGETLGLTGAGTVADRNVGADKPVSIGTLELKSGTGLASNYTLIGGAHKATITVRPLSTWIGGPSGAWSNPANWDALPDGNNVLAVSIPVGTAVAFDSTLGNLKLNSLTGGGSLSLTGGSLSVASAINVAQFNMSGGALDVTGAMSVTSSYNQTAGSVTASGPVSVVQTAGNMSVGAISAPSISLTASNGAISQIAPVVTGSLTTQSSSGTVLTDAGNKVSSFTASNTGTGNIALTNVGVLTIPSITNNIGDITINNIGGITTVGAVKTTTGSITGVANSPLTIGAGGVSASGNITLTATNLTSSGNLTLDGPVSSSGGSVALAAASNYVQNSNVSAAQGVSATAGGEMTFGPQALTSGNPVSYSANGVTVIAPGTNTSQGSAPVDFVATFMSKFEDAVAAQTSTADPDDKKKEKDVVVEGQSCTR